MSNYYIVHKASTRMSTGEIAGWIVYKERRFIWDKKIANFGYTYPDQITQKKQQALELVKELNNAQP